MSRLGTYTRRGFLVATVAVAGGVVFGFRTYRENLENPLSATLAPGEAALTPYIKITADGITIITPRAEMGQGMHTTLAALVAEELDVELADVTVEHGPPSSAYFNGGVIEEGYPFPATDQGALAEFARARRDIPAIFLAYQITGGSTSTHDAYEKMRRAGAVGRETLKAVAKSTGQAIYASDVRLPDMRFAAIRRSPYPGGTLRSFDATAALAIPGVDTVLDIGTGAVAIADTTWAAQRALDAVTAEWAPLETPADTEGHFSAIAAAFTPERQAGRLRDDGDVESILASTDAIEAEYRVPYLAHVTLEPMSAAALWKDGRLQIWTGTQGPTVARREAARAAGIEEDAVTITTTLLGGGFGRRGEMDFVQNAARVAVRIEGTPVLLTYGREDDTAGGPFRPAAIGRFRALVKEGLPFAVDVSIASPSILKGINDRGGAPAPTPDFVPDFTIGQALWDQSYGIEHYRATAYKAEPLLPVGFWRAVGATQNTFFHECMMDELAVAGGRDPIDMRLNLLTDEPSRRVLEAVAEMAAWGDEVEPERARGVAFALVFGAPTAQIVEVERTPQGIKVTHVWVAANVGVALDPRNLDAQLISGVSFGLSAAIGEKITVAEGRVEQLNYHDYRPLRMSAAPPVTTRILENAPHIRGIGEPGTPCAAPALANAVFALTGERIRTLPLADQVAFA